MYTRNTDSGRFNRIQILKNESIEFGVNDFSFIDTRMNARAHAYAHPYSHARMRDIMSINSNI